jgi:hypothetical protein
MQRPIGNPSHPETLDNGLVPLGSYYTMMESMAGRIEA